MLTTSDNFDSASVVEDSFEYLDAPVERIAGADVPMPYAPNIEKMAVPQVGFVLYLVTVVIIRDGTFKYYHFVTSFHFNIN